MSFNKIFLVFILTFISTEQSCEPIYKFNTLDDLDNQPLVYIRDIHQDTDGVLWFATFNKILKYDGYEAEEFNYDRDKKVLGTFALLHLDNKKVLIATSSGLIIANKSNGQTNIIDKENGLQSNWIFSISKANDEIYLGSNEGIDRFNLKSKKISKILTFRNEIKFSHQKKVYSFYFSKEESRVYASTHEGIYIIDSLTGNIIDFISTIERDLHITSIFKSNNKGILVGTERGLFVLDIKNKQLTIAHEELKETHISTIAEDSDFNLWIGTFKQGLFISDRTLTKLSNTNVRKFLDDDILSIYFSNSNVSWIGTKNGGIHWRNVTEIGQSYYTKQSKEFSCLEDNHIGFVKVLSESELLIASDSSQMILNSKNNKCRLFFAKNIQHALTFLQNAPNERNWVGTINGLYQFSQDRMPFLVPDFPKTIYFDFVQMPNGDYLFAGIEGIYYLRKNTKRPKLIKDPTIKELVAYKLAMLNSNEVLVGTYNGLYLLDSNFKLRKAKLLREDIEKLPIRTIFFDSNQNLWLGVNKVGLYILNENLEIAKSYTDLNELHSLNGIYDIIEDSDGYIWITSTYGISKLNPMTDEILNFHTSDGLQGEVFTPGAIAKDHNQVITIGGKKGLNRFNSKNVSKNLTPPNVSIKKFFHFNKEITANEKYNGKVLPLAIQHLDLLELTHEDYSFGLEFTGVHFGDPKRNKFAFMLSGHDTDWNYTDHKYRRAYYTNLPAGDYIFKVKAANLHGVWSAPKKLEITILPPFWLTPTAYLIYALLVIFSVYTIVTYRTRTLTQRAKVLEDSIQERTKELATEKYKVEQLLSKKNDEFTNVSHEFRTPLTLILGPLKTFIQKHQGKIETSELSVIERNSQRLLRMVNQMLNMETLKVNAITKRTPENFFLATELAVKAFRSVANEKDIQLTLSQKQEVCFDFTPDAYEKIILNLLSNAIKYTEPHGEVIVTSERNGQNEFILTVKDNGIGIAKNKQALVFERFNRVINEDSERVTGAGIGLALVKDLVKAHDGRVELESELGEGTKVSIFLPIINEVDASQVDLHENNELAAMELMALAEDQMLDDNNQLGLEDNNSSKPSVLIIEDNADMRHYIESNINNIYQVLTAKNGDEGVKLAESEVPDLIISDIMMPKMNGYQVTRALRENQATSHIPIILLTAKSDLESRIKGWQENADEYLTKPFSIEELLVRLKNLLDIRDILKKRFADVAFTLSDKSSTNQQPSNQEEDQHEFLIKLNNILDEIYKDSDVKIKDVSAKIAMSDRQFHRKLKSIVDLSPNEYLRRYRLEKAKELLVQGKSANYAAFEVGFSSQSYFGRCFKALYGCSPSEINKQNPN